MVVRKIGLVEPAPGKQSVAGPRCRHAGINGTRGDSSSGTAAEDAVAGVGQQRENVAEERREAECDAGAAEAADGSSDSGIGLDSHMGNERQAAPLPETSGHQAFLVVARGHRDLLAELEAVIGEALGWVRVIEDRRRDASILPREGARGRPYVDRETS